MPKNIELEIRAIVEKKDFGERLKKLKGRGKLASKTNRLTVAFYGTCEKNNFAISIRVTDGKSEVVIKKGDFHTHNRTEYSQKIPNGRFIEMVRIFSQLDFYGKVFERTTYNYRFPGNITVSLVTVSDYSYIEIEKMTDRKNEKKVKLELMKVAGGLGLKIIKTKKAYYDYCDMLTEKVDWRFFGTKKDFAKLERILRQKVAK
ncbi:MAG: CYTH domain-containing protein [Candidatus Paceibacterota bacterium]|jgi:adenylate cyclase class IV